MDKWGGRQYPTLAWSIPDYKEGMSMRQLLGPSYITRCVAITDRSRGFRLLSQYYFYKTFGNLAAAYKGNTCLCRPSMDDLHTLHAHYIPHHAVFLLVGSLYSVTTPYVHPAFALGDATSPPSWGAHGLEAPPSRVHFTCGDLRPAFGLCS